MRRSEWQKAHGRLGVIIIGTVRQTRIKKKSSTGSPLGLDGSNEEPVERHGGSGLEGVQTANALRNVQYVQYSTPPHLHSEGRPALLEERQLPRPSYQGRDPCSR